MYLNIAINLPLTLSADRLKFIKWWADGAFLDHGGMESHTGETMILGKMLVCSTSTKHKFKTKSSTEAELIGVTKAMLRLLCAGYSLEAKGYRTSESLVYKDNKSATIL